MSASNKTIAFFVNAGAKAITLAPCRKTEGDVPVYVQTESGVPALFATRVLGKATAEQEGGAPNVIRWEVSTDRFQARVSEKGNAYFVLDLTDPADLAAWLAEVKPLVRTKHVVSEAAVNAFDDVFGPASKGDPEEI